MPLDSPKQLLEALVVGNADLDLLEERLAQFNVFEAIGAVRQEVRHSDFLRFLLDPSENHGLGDVFLKAFLKQSLAGDRDYAVGVVDIDVSDLDDAVIERERMNIDVLIRSASQRIAVAIENKVDSNEHSNQLERYRKDLAREFPGYRQVLIFLTPEGEEPSDPEWISVGYQVVVDSLEALQRTRRSTLGADVLASIQHYSTMLRRHVVNESDVAELCRKLYRAHKKAFDLILEYRQDLQSNTSEAIGEILDADPSFGRIIGRRATFASIPSSGRAILARSPARAGPSPDACFSSRWRTLKGRCASYSSSAPATRNSVTRSINAPSPTRKYSEAASTSSTQSGR